MAGEVNLSQWAHDAAVMREFKLSPAWEVIKRHLLLVRDSHMGALFGSNDYSAILTHRGAAIALDHATNLPESVINEYDRLRTQAERRKGTV